MSMSMLAIGELKRRLEGIAYLEDAKFCFDPRIPYEVRLYWSEDLRRRRFYESNLLWEKYEPEKLEYLPMPVGTTYNGTLEIGGGECSIWDMAGINLKLVPEGYIYYCSTGFGGKLKILLGEIEAQERVREVDVYRVSRELVCNCEINSPALYNHVEKIIIGRKRSAEFSVWRRIEELKNAIGVEKQLLESELRNLTGFRQEDFWREPIKLEIGVKRAAEHKLGAWVAHELGHLAAKRYLSHSTFNALKKFCISRGDLALDAYVTAVNDVLADTICEDEIKGTIGYILQESEPQKIGLLSSHVLDVINPPAGYKVLVEKRKLEAELVSTFLDWLSDVKDVDLDDRMDNVRRTVFERAVLVASDLSTRYYPWLLDNGK